MRGSRELYGRARAVTGQLPTACGPPAKTRWIPPTTVSSPLPFVWPQTLWVPGRNTGKTGPEMLGPGPSGKSKLVQSCKTVRGVAVCDRAFQNRVPQHLVRKLGATSSFNGLPYGGTVVRVIGEGEMQCRARG